MRFADPESCPDCRGAIAGQTSCPHCGLDLTTSEVRHLWQVLLQADDLLARAGRYRLTVQPPPPPVQPPVPPAQPVPQPQPPQPAPEPAPEPAPPAPSMVPMQPYPAPPVRDDVTAERSWSVGTILLVLGAFGLIVAGLIFVTRSWADLGLAGRTLILMGVTAAIAGLGVWVTRRPLRASAEAVWTVFVTLLSLDFFAAHHEDLLGLRALSYPGTYLVWGVVLLAVSTALAVWARTHLHEPLLSMAVAGGVGITMAAIGAGGAVNDMDFAWRALIAVIVAGVLALATRPARLKPTTLAARVVFALFFAGAYAAALIELVRFPTLRELVVDAHGGPMLLIVIAALVAAALVPVGRIALTALAIIGASALCLTPAAQVGDGSAAWAATSALATVLAVAGLRGSGDWGRGIRLGGSFAVVGLALLHASLLGQVFETFSAALDSPWSIAWDGHIAVRTVNQLDGWAVPIAVVALVIVTWAVTRWPELAQHRRYASLAVAAAVAVGTLNAVVSLNPAVWIMSAALVGLAVVLLLLRLGGLRLAKTPEAGLITIVLTGTLIAAASVVAAASQGVSVWTWLVGAALLTVVTVTEDHRLGRQITAGSAAVLLVCGVTSLVDLLGADAAITTMSALVIGLGLMAGAGLLLPSHATRVPLELTGGAAAFVAVLMHASNGELALRWTIVGVVLIALSMAIENRRFYVWPGLGSLVIAYILLIVDSGFSFVEAYTLPLGVAALGAGGYLMRRSPQVSTWALLGPGLAISLIPSLPQALAAPTELRALILGVASLLTLGIAIRLRWQAPFVLAASVLVLLVLFNIGPYANAAPRVVVIAIGSAILLGVGITWEDRVRDGRRIVSYVRSMR